MLRVVCSKFTVLYRADAVNEDERQKLVLSQENQNREWLSTSPKGAPGGVTTKVAALPSQIRCRHGSQGCQHPSYDGIPIRKSK